jgi:hypothetical protein
MRDLYCLTSEAAIARTIHVPSTYHRTDGRVLTIVKPHGDRKTCFASDIKRLLGILGHEHNS